MSTAEEDDDEISYALSGGVIHSEWKELWDSATSGERSWLTKMKKHYAKVLENDAEAAAEMLAMQEHRFAQVRNSGLLDKKQ